MTEVDIKALAKLARLDVNDAELARLETEIPAIVAFVDTIQKVEGAALETPELRNVVRPDTDPHESGAYTDALLNAAPVRVENRIAVKQVVSRTAKK